MHNSCRIIGGVEAETQVAHPDDDSHWADAIRLSENTVGAENAVGDINLPYKGCFEENSRDIKAFLIDSNDDTYGSPIQCYFLCKNRGSQYFGIQSKSCRCSDDTAEVPNFNIRKDDVVCTKIYGDMYSGSYLHRTMAIYSTKANPGNY